MQNFNKTHPELKSGEVFHCNSIKRDFEALIFKTKRMGEISFTRDGKVLSINHSPWNKSLFPVFVNSKEVANFTDIPQNFKEGDSVIFYNSEVLLRGTIKEEHKLLWIIEDFDGCEYTLEKETVITNCLVPNYLKPYDEETYNLMKFKMEESQNLILSCNNLWKSLR